MAVNTTVGANFHDILVEEWKKRNGITDDSSYNLTVEQIRELLNPKNYEEYWREKMTRNVIIICFYCTIALVSLFGNLLVCYVIFKKKRMRTETNILMANLTVSDIMMTVINIPFNVARILLDDWPFGSFLCVLVPLMQVTSVYVSTFSMTIIAIDRYQAIINPLHRRLSTSVPIVMIIAIIWLTAGTFSIPNVAFNRVVEISGHKTLYRCRALYPYSQRTYRQIITMFTFLTQYAVPLSITAFAYLIISFNIWFKLLAPDSDQQKTRERSRRRTIKMLAIVVLVFAICWLPLNIFHIYSDFNTDANIHDMNWFLVCHWFAMSSVCYNPWIYFCLNKHFRQEIKNIVHCTRINCWSGAFVEESSTSSSLRGKNNLQRTNAVRLITTNNGLIPMTDNADNNIEDNIPMNSEIVSAIKASIIIEESKI